MMHCAPHSIRKEKAQFQTRTEKKKKIAKNGIEDDEYAYPLVSIIWAKIQRKRFVNTNS